MSFLKRLQLNLIFHFAENHELKPILLQKAMALSAALFLNSPPMKSAFQLRPIF
jgi:hypothetical protein